MAEDTGPPLPLTGVRVLDVSQVMAGPFASMLLGDMGAGVTKRLGIDYATLSKINPRLIYASISGFGQTGPWSQRPGFDLIAQAMAGVMSITGHPGGPPTKSGVPVSDIGCAL